MPFSFNAARTSSFEGLDLGHIMDSWESKCATALAKSISVLKPPSSGILAMNSSVKSLILIPEGGMAR
jgi:hypothetical protein